MLGLLFYTVNQGTQFLALERLPAVTTSLLLSFTPILVALLGISLLAEKLTRAQWSGIALYLSGALVYFYPAAIPAGQIVGRGDCAGLRAGECRLNHRSDVTSTAPRLCPR